MAQNCLKKTFPFHKNFFLLLLQGGAVENVYQQTFGLTNSTWSIC